MGEQGEIVRPAGLMEQYHITRHALGFDSCVLSAAQFVPPAGSSLDETTLFCALRKVMESHPALGVRLAGEHSTTSCYERLDKIYLSQVVEFSDSCDLKAAFEAQLLRPFDAASTLPLWRIVVLNDNTVCFAWHHCIGDGISGLAFHRALLAALRQGGGHEPLETDAVAPSTNALISAMEATVDVTPSWRKIFLEVFEHFAPGAWTRGASAWTGKPVENISLQTSVRLIEFPPDNVSTFLTLCRAHKATLTSGLHVLAISVLSALVSTEAEKYKTISSYIPISLRGLTGASNDVFCEHLSAMHTYPRVNPIFSWDEASRCASALRSCTPTSVEEVGMLKFLFGKYAAFFKGKVGKKRQGGLEISNLGPFEASSDRAGGETWTIGRTGFAQCDAPLGSAIKINVVGDPLGGMTIAVTWGVGSIENSFGESFVSSFRDGFAKVISTKADEISLAG
ncbi:hypothetical protein LshimejAT787_1004560 [Lyophyllum shimeji]|uniref:Alcohol acetyltransferase n=1 Tax=Lyophyllum shimeji TaxID=47721 RepID=A0A9P3PUD3_LYOSH|nr:hypothetical protein LshimejAT787_1004560 [Lyophyllum shimeji]